MKLARVAGTVVATIKDPALTGRRLLHCDLLDSAGKPSGAYTLAVDTVDAGPGEMVVILDEGSSARQVLDDPRAPLRAVIVGIVDAVTVDGQDLPR